MIFLKILATMSPLLGQVGHWQSFLRLVLAYIFAAAMPAFLNRSVLPLLVLVLALPMVFLLYAWTDPDND